MFVAMDYSLAILSICREKHVCYRKPSVVTMRRNKHFVFVLRGGAGSGVEPHLQVDFGRRDLERGNNI